MISRGRSEGRIPGPWVKLPQSLIDTGVFKDPVCRHLFTDLLMLASPNGANEVVRGIRIELDRGQIHTSLSDLTRITGYSIQRVRTALRNLEECGAIITNKSSIGTKISICNWGTYQDFSSAGNKPRTSKHACGVADASHAQVPRSMQDNHIDRPKKEEGNCKIEGEPHSSSRDKTEETQTDKPHLLKAVMEIFLEEARKAGIPTTDEALADRWEKSLEGVISDIERQCGEDEVDVTHAIRMLLRAFFADDDRAERRAQKPGYFKKDWVDYWPQVTLADRRSKRNVRRNMIYEKIQELRPENRDLNPYDMMTKARRELGFDKPESFEKATLEEGGDPPARSGLTDD